MNRHSAFAVALTLPPLENGTFEDDSWSCGLWLRHHVEEEHRRYSQEGFWTQRCCKTASMFSWLSGIRGRFRASLSEEEKVWAADHDFKGS